MKEIIERISSYNLFNYLLPGILFAAFAEHITDYKIIQDDILVGLFLYYFIGLVISRIGSLLLAPLLRRIRLIKFAPYADFVSASKADPKLEVLSEQNNMYRTLCALFLSLGILKLVENVAPDEATETAKYALIGLGFVLFAGSYVKQTNFITQRVKHKHNSVEGT